MRIIYGIVAGLVASVVLGILYVLVRETLAIPFDPIASLGRILGTYLGGQASPANGWVVHFVIGGFLWGGLFGAVASRIPVRGRIAKAVVFSVFAWLAMMIVFAPLAGWGLFAHLRGLEVTGLTLVLHLIFGLVMGLTMRPVEDRSPDAIKRGEEIEVEREHEFEEGLGR